MNKLGKYCSNSGDNTYLRGILKKNNFYELQKLQKK